MPIPLKLFCAYLLIMFLPIALIQAFYILLADDWTFGFKNKGPIQSFVQSAFFIMIGHHVYRIFTAVALFLKARFAVRNARIYVLASFALIVAFVLSIAVSPDQPASEMQMNTVGAVMGKTRDAGFVVILALALMLPWWLILSKSRKIREFNSAEKTRSAWP